MKLSEDFHLEFDENNVVWVFSEERFRIREKRQVIKKITLILTSTTILM